MADKQSLLEEAEDFLTKIIPFLVVTRDDEPTNDSSDTADAVVITSVEEIVQWAKQLRRRGTIYKVMTLQPLWLNSALPHYFFYTQVLITMRTGVSCQGKEVLAICLEDMTETLPHAPSLVTKNVKAAKMGKHKDFVPGNSTDPVIKREVNNISRYCNLAWYIAWRSMWRSKER